MNDIITTETYKNRTDINFHIQTVKKPLYPLQRENGPYVYEDKVLSGYYRKHNFDQLPIKRKIWQFNVRHNLTVHCSVTPFIIWQPIQRPHLLERVYKPMRTLH